MSDAEVAAQLNTHKKSGLSEKEAAARLLHHGKNTLAPPKARGFFKKFISQFNDFMIIILLSAAAISFLMSLSGGSADLADPIVILLIVVLNALLGTVQEARAERAIAALKEISAPTAVIRRGGKNKALPAEELVPGDILIFRPGTRIAADCRLISSNSLCTDESSLTGESLPVKKTHDEIFDPLTPLAERKNMVYSGTSVISGKGEGICVAAGMNTELGKIAEMIAVSPDVQTPLKKKLSHIGKLLGILALSICVIIFLIGILKSFPPFDMFMMSVSLAVAAIPEGLPAIVTIMLAIGVQAMAKKNAIVRNLPAVEALGGASVICSDKTGTLTRNQMEVAEIFSDDKAMLFRFAVLCCDLEAPNPTERAIIAYAKKHFGDKAFGDNSSRIGEIPFDSARKLMTCAHKTASGMRIVTKGAPDVLIKLCTKIHSKGTVRAITEAEKKEIMLKNAQMADNALRVIAVAYKTSAADMSEKELTFLGLIGLHDPPRREVPAAVRSCLRSGIRPVMITGDHLNTACAIARKTGILRPGDKAITGNELDKIPQSVLEKCISDYSVFARVTPAHKVRIVEAWQKQGKIVAMTGDGVNDAPALKKADIGCSMGKSGTDVAKNASDIILTDDNFATIVSAVKKGREIFENLKKSVKFLLSSNIGEIAAVFVGLIFGISSPLYPIQLLWINLVTDSLPAVALGLDPPSEDIMSRPPRADSTKLFGRGMWGDIFIEGAMIGALALLAFSIGAVFFDPIGENAIGRTMAFSVLGLSQLVHAFNMRSEGSVINRSIFKNKFLVFALLLGVLLQVLIISHPALAPLFKAVPLNAVQWLTVGALSLMPLPIVELQKAVTKHFLS